MLAAIAIPSSIRFVGAMVAMGARGQLDV